MCWRYAPAANENIQGRLTFNYIVILIYIIPRFFSIARKLESPIPVTQAADFRIGMLLGAVDIQSRKEHGKGRRFLNGNTVAVARSTTSLPRSCAKRAKAVPSNTEDFSA